jgi:hypothetical protein
MAIALGVALIVVDTTIVNVTVPLTIEDLNVNSVQAQWFQESHAIILAAMPLLVGQPTKRQPRSVNKAPGPDPQVLTISRGDAAHQLAALLGRQSLI